MLQFVRLRISPCEGDKYQECCICLFEPIPIHSFKVEFSSKVLLFFNFKCSFYHFISKILCTGKKIRFEHPFKWWVRKVRLDFDDEVIVYIFLIWLYYVTDVSYLKVQVAGIYLFFVIEVALIVLFLPLFVYHFVFGSW